MSNDTSSDPIIAGRQPETVTLTKGDEYVWCACGRSRTQPFCDGSHAGTGFQPVAFRATESGGAALCMCEHTHGAPYCDGTHATLPRDESAKTEPSLPAAAPGIPALARARHYLDTRQSRIALIVTGGLRMPEDFVKALCLGADGGALANSAIQAVGCIAARVCNTNNCPAGVATQKPELRARLDVARGAQRLTRVPRSVDAAHAGACPGMRSLTSQPVRSVRHHHLEEGDGRSHWNSVRGLRPRAMRPRRFRIDSDEATSEAQPCPGP